MLIYLPFNKVVSTVVAIAVVVIVTCTGGPLTTNGFYCDAFSAVEIFVGRAQPFSSSTTATAKIYTADAPTIRHQLQSTLVSAMTSSDESDEKMATITTEDDDKDKENNPQFDDVAWKAYETTMENIMIQRRVIKKCDEDVILSSSFLYE